MLYRDQTVFSQKTINMPGAKLTNSCIISKLFRPSLGGRCVFEVMRRYRMSWTLCSLSTRESAVFRGAADFRRVREIRRLVTPSRKLITPRVVHGGYGRVNLAPTITHPNSALPGSPPLNSSFGLSTGVASKRRQTRSSSDESRESELRTWSLMTRLLMA